MRRICTICARGGSKGVKNKNVRPLLGKPLLAFSIRQAKLSGLFNYVAVSSDSKEILEIASFYGADILVERPADLATDESAKKPAIEHCVKQAENITQVAFDTMVDIDATSPLRLVEDLQGAVRFFEEGNGSNLITAMPARRSPYFNLVELNEKGFVQLSKELLQPVVRRQDAPKCFDMNASIYIWNREAFWEKSAIINDDTLLFEMPEDRSIDIDSELDFKIVEMLMNEKREIYEALFI
ncbi:acylneuraminate cytidylyltransferase family protein [Brevibacillus borstelensis]|uniref:acylneuraminate cytidylyltransferase family protein n=1 Tax=Brevibacillus borstelensis TaxID=45462 RepID=UPI00203D9AB7|nr:acylneuraminate cytidylyltransferase family protein [Brevibacillus borstelensis]MCM3590178.1 acylneuraminate cytidylyltransferase family protein [Brevibacillus borstelensis]